MDLGKLNSEGVLPISTSCHNFDPAKDSHIPQNMEKTYDSAPGGVEHNDPDQENNVNDENNVNKETKVNEENNVNSVNNTDQENYPGEVILADKRLTWYQFGESEMQESTSGTWESPFIEDHVHHQIKSPESHDNQIKRINKRQLLPNQQAAGSNKRRHH
ncbi:uncharacterized protein MELLADRAFT_59464 [Melampsora larici-populina 98AG31]|uniref:Uncharacterized protein n=1 Tax=Melampsora larici-populina (strain 98AG31 / pathotype 3-4-7) TaxID=747676 RepID=F4R7K8_MELLP|nr:uncharacterized protein MELLADRAFT_59464 [Melampsora larici-populina 98AG31]EGG11332.1 hypothetical protein MELLADRAFT_59464 [Melampsora larici-populina 98AG31]